MKKWQRMYYQAKSCGYDASRLRRLRETRVKLRTFISAQDGLHDEYKEALLEIVEAVIGKTSREEVADFLQHLVEGRIESALDRIVCRIARVPPSFAGEPSHVRSSALVRTTRQQTRFAWIPKHTGTATFEGRRSASGRSAACDEGSS